MTPYFERLQTPPEDFAEATRKLRDKHGIEPPVDPDDVVTIANLYPRMSVDEVAERLGKDPAQWQRWTPGKMDRRIEDLRERAHE